MTIQLTLDYHQGDMMLQPSASQNVSLLRNGTFKVNEGHLKVVQYHRWPIKRQVGYEHTGQDSSHKYTRRKWSQEEGSG